MPEPAAGSAVARMEKLLGKTFKVTLRDGRVFTGEFQALDKQGNLVMGKAVEWMGHDKSQERFVGMVLVPSAQRQSVELQVSLEEKLDMLKLVEVA